VVHARIVEIDGLLDAAQPQDIGKEPVVGARLGGKRGDGDLSYCVAANITIVMGLEILTMLHRLYLFQIQLQATAISIWTQHPLNV